MSPDSVSDAGLLIAAMETEASSPRRSSLACITLMPAASMPPEPAVECCNRLRL